MSFRYWVVFLGLVLFAFRQNKPIRGKIFSAEARYGGYMRRVRRSDKCKGEKERPGVT